MSSRAALIAASATSLILTAAVAAGLAAAGIWITPRLPSQAVVRQWIHQPLTAGFVIALVQVAAAALWLFLATAVLARAYTRMARALRWLPALRLPGPLQGLTAALLGATAISAAAAATPVSAAPAAGSGHDTGNPLVDEPAGNPLTQRVDAGREMTLVAAGREYTYTVKRGDTLSKIAKQWLGDASRWREIFVLNRGTHFADVGGTLRNPNVIYPGWTLDLPADATPPAGHQPRSPADKAPPSSTASGDAPSDVPDASPPHPGPAAPSPGPQQPAAPAPATAAAPDDNAAASPAPTADAASPAATDVSRGSERACRGVGLPSGSWVDLGLALAIVAAVALVWAHRQRRYVPRRSLSRPHLDDPALAPMPRVVRQIRRGLRRADTDPYGSTRPRPADASDGEPGLAGKPKLGGAGSDSGAEELDDRKLDHDGGLPAATEGMGDSPSPVVPALDNPLSALWPSVGLGLTGPGADAAARGLLTAALACGGVESPEAHVEVVIPSATAAALLGAPAVALPHTPRLIVTAGLDEALDILEAQAMRRTRLTDLHEVGTVAELRRADPFEEPLPPVMLLADTPSRQERARVAAVLAQGKRLDIHGVLLGDWPDGATVAVAADGDTNPANGDSAQHPAHVGRLTVLNPAEAIDLLTTLAESHTGLPPTPTPVGEASSPAPTDTAHSPQSPPTPAIRGDIGVSAEAGRETDDTDGRAAVTADVVEAAVSTARALDAAQPPAPAPARSTADNDAEQVSPSEAADGRQGGEPVRVRVLGAPGVVDSDPQRTPRAKSLELLVYLAVHDGAASSEAILDDLLPDAPASKAPSRLYTYVSGLRAVLRRTGGSGGHVTHPDHRYILNRDLLDVDLWRMRAAIRDAAQASDPQARTAALRRAVDAYTGPLAEGRDYEWVESYREAVRQEALDAYLALADSLTGQPEQQLRVLDAAIAHNPHHEALYQAAMRARAQLGDVDGIRALRRTLTRRLAEIDAEPSDDILGLADRLVADLRHPGYASGTRRSPDTGGAAA